MRNPIALTLPRARRLGALMLLYGVASIASAQWAWRDEHGRTVYSDEPPPPTIRAGNILRQPESAPNSSPDPNGADAQGQTNPAPAAAAPAPAPKVAAPVAPRPPTMAERELEFRKRMKDRADAEKKLADAQADADRKSDACERARGYLKSIESGIRLMRTNPDGSRELLDETQRDAETQRTRDIIASTCN
jgi:hypothetical protein